MSTVPVPTNPTIGTVDQIIQGLIFDVGVRAAIAYATAQLPFLSFPIIKQLFAWAVGKLASAIYVQLENQIAFSVINFQTDKQKNDYMDAIAALMIATNSGDKNAIDKATTDVRSTLGSLIHFNGS